MWCLVSGNTAGITGMKKSDLPLRSDSEIAALYRALRRAGSVHGFSLAQAFDGALGHPFAYGAGYMDNFRKGRVDRSKAAKLYSWLRHQYPAHANDLDAEIVRLNTPAPPEGWEAFIREHGTFGQARLVAAQRQQQQLQVRQQQMGIWEREERFQQSFPLNLPFTFHFEGQFRPYAVGLQWLRGQWFALPLGDGTIGTPLTERRQFPDKFSVELEDRAFNEPDETGLHRFVFILTDQEAGAGIAQRLSADSAIAAAVLDGLASDLLATRAKAPWSLLRLHVMFVVSEHYGFWR